ncbi:MAG: hypothetical protein EPN88_17210 [Bacteroidetes bacterium]|nr:MAG: hypothetical protein EPN88_17210 [Bacteroidota bacterium]
MKILKLVLSVVPDLSFTKRVGRPFVYKPRVVICCFLVMVAKRLSVRGLHALLTNKEDLLAVQIRKTIPFPKEKIPTRRTFDRRLKTSMKALQYSMVAVVLFAVKHFHLGIAHLAVDNRMFEAFGAIWHRKYQEKGIIPDKLRNVDRTAGWGISHYRGWVYGHALEVFVTTGRIVFPVVAFARSLLTRGNTAVKQFGKLLPRVKRGSVVADSEYADDELALLLGSSGRKLFAPDKRNQKAWKANRRYKKRKITIEPFFERLLLAFPIRGKLDRKGPQAWPYLVLCCLLYQLMVTYNLMHHAGNPMEVTHLIRML